MQHDLEIILVEDDVELCEEFEKCFEETEGIELAATTDSAEQALEFVRRLQPDVVILDLELHMGEGNGITFLSKLRKLRGIQKPYVLVNTNNSSRITYDIVRNLGADFVMFKHTQGHCPSVIAEFLLAVASGSIENTEGESDDAVASRVQLEQSDSCSGHLELRKRIYDELNKVCISPKRKGYNYLADAIEIFCGGHVSNVSALIGEKYGKKAKSVERAMQNAIDSAWDDNDLDELGKHYKARISGNRISPTIMEFIGYYSAKLGKED